MCLFLEVFVFIEGVVKLRMCYYNIIWFESKICWNNIEVIERCKWLLFLGEDWGLGVKVL